VPLPETPGSCTFTEDLQPFDFGEYRMISTTPMREFTEVQQELETINSNLKGTTDTRVKQQLLREMRQLLAEADRILKPQD
jgi:hypothetical protein